MSHRSTLVLRCLTCAVAAMAAATGSAVAASGEFYETHFDSLSDLDRWQITGASNWRVDKGNLIDPGLSEKQILTVRTYDPDASDTIESDVLLEVHALIGDGDPEARIGAVFNFIDPDNYSEVTISAAGDVRGRAYIGGVLHEGRELRSAEIAPGVNKWFTLSLRYSVMPGNVMLTDVHLNGVRLDDIFVGAG
jgi:hypothetical protein